MLQICGAKYSLLRRNLLFCFQLLVPAGHICKRTFVEYSTIYTPKPDIHTIIFHRHTGICLWASCRSLTSPAWDVLLRLFARVLHCRYTAPFRNHKGPDIIVHEYPVLNAHTVITLCTLKRCAESYSCSILQVNSRSSIEHHESILRQPFNIALKTLN